MFKFVGNIFIILGIIFFPLGQKLKRKNEEFISNAVPVHARIAEIQTYRNKDDINHNVFVTYDYNWEHYDSIELHYYSSSYHEGDIITIYIDPTNPTRADVPEAGKLLGLVFTILSVSFLAAGILVVILFGRF